MLEINMMFLSAKKRRWFLLTLFLMEAAHEVVMLCSLLPSMYATAPLLATLREVLFYGLISAIVFFVLLRGRRSA